MILTYMDSLKHRYTDTVKDGKLIQRIVVKPDSREQYSHLEGDRWIYEVSRCDGDRLRSRATQVVDYMPENPSFPITAIAQ